MVETLVVYGLVAAAALWLCRPLLRPLMPKAPPARKSGADGCNCGGSGCGD